MNALLEAMAVKICKDECPVYDPYDRFSPVRSGPRWKCFIDRAVKQLESPEMKRVIHAARVEGFKAGQEAMRERAALEAINCDDDYGHGVAAEIRDLPVEEPTAG
ncbi:hypothetical protein [Rhizobium leguminosarum]|uniref:hypothetical protein n=1 Tax=Rhizobium leguminosarum TaxID=384 RepID=UPI0035174388